MLRILLVLMLWQLSACGFHLRSDVQIDAAYSPLLVDAETLSTEQQQQLRRALTRASAIVLDQPDAAAHRLQLSVSPLRSRKVARSNVTAVTLLQADMALQFQLFDGNGKALFATQEIRQSMEIERDDNNLLAQQDQLQNARRILFGRLLERMISRLSVAAASHPANGMAK